MFLVCRCDLHLRATVIKQEVETLQENEHRQKQEIDIMKSKERDPIEMEDELKQIKRKKKSMMQENKVLQQKAENLRRKMSRRDELSEKLWAKQEKYTELLRQFLQETTEQLCETEKNKKQHQNVEAQPGCSHWDMPKMEAENKRDISKSSETLPLTLTKARDREIELFQQTAMVICSGCQFGGKKW